MATLEKKYVYKVSRDGTYLGVLPNVSTEFEYSHNINSAGCQLMVTVSDSADTSNLPVEALLDEYGNELLAEDGSVLTTERVADLVGDGNSNSLIRNDNDVEVVEYSEYYPNGKTVFQGFMSKLKVYFGGSDSVDITILSNGQDLAHYLVPGGNAETIDQSSTTTDTDFASWWDSGSGHLYGQTFTTGVGVTNISSIRILLQVNSSSYGSVTLKLWSSTASASPSGTGYLGAVTKTLTAQSLTETTFTFATPIMVTASTTYFWAIVPDPGSIGGDVNTWISMGINFSGSVYAGGAAHSWSGGPYSAGGGGSDFYFKTYSSAYSTAHAYTNDDPSTDILTDIMSSYSNSGGSLSLSTPSATGTSVNYTFNLNTILEGVNKVLELGPSDWYWYVNPANNTLYYEQASTTADHTMIKGRHINELSIEMTKEQIANVVYFTGGEVTAGVNAYVNVNDTASLLVNKRGLVRLNDPKVKGATGNATGTIIANNYIDGHDEQTYITQIEIVDGTYDITLFDIGEIVGFGSFGTFVDRLLLQIVGIKRKVDSVVLSLGVLPHRATEQMEEVQRSLEASQTVNNPSAPS